MWSSGEQFYHSDLHLSCREDSKKIFKAHHAQLRAQTIDVLQEKLENKRIGKRW